MPNNRLIRQLLFCAALSTSLPASWGHDVITTKLTWTREISRIVRKNCSSCHHNGGAAMSLATYQEARPWAVAIREEVLARRMPPWPAVPGYGEFRNQLALSAQEIFILANWVEGGAPEGEAEYLPTHSHIGRQIENKPLLGNKLLVSDGFRVPKSMAIGAIQWKSGLETQQIKLRAILPDGAVQPLVWLLPMSGPTRKRQLLYQAPVQLPAGSILVTEPPAAGQFLLTVVPTRAH